MANENLHGAKTAKNDEFYTQFHDIEKEMNAYLDYDAEVFKGKTVLLPCDDPEWSNFTKYFAQNFDTLGLKKLISTSYAPNSKPKEIPYQPTLFEIDSPDFDETKTQSNGKIFTLSQDTTGDKVINVDDLEWGYLGGDGDFRSDEIAALRDEADVIITNPPFSLFREFWAWLIESQKNFVVLGNMNAVTYREVFPHIRANEVWAGTKQFGGGMNMIMPTGTFDAEKAGSYSVNDEGLFIKNIMGVIWFTNLDHGRRHQPLALMTEADNKRFSKHKQVRDIGYRKYENYDAIEVPFNDAIPSDYDGLIGVPITFLGKYAPEQFEIIGTSDNGLVDERFKTTPGLTQAFVDDYYKAGGKGAYRAGNPTAGIYETEIAKMVYKRIFIKHKRTQL
jgi:hypothetical protein